MSNNRSSFQPSETVLRASTTNVGRLFKGVAEQHTTDVAIIEHNQKVTYGELNNRVNQLANALTNKGLKRGDRIGLISRNCSSFLEIELACAKTGIILVSINWRLTREEVTHCMKLTQPSLVFFAAEFQKLLENIDEIELLLLQTEYENLLSNSHNKEPTDKVDKEDGLVIIFTSGTTGLPKGALISHRAMITRALIFATETGAPQKDTFIAWTPLFHMGSNDFSIATLLRGGQVVVVD